MTGLRDELENGSVQATTAEHSGQLPDLFVEVYATRRGRQWRLTYAKPCLWCKKRHYYGGGTGDEPYGGNRVDHCLVREAPATVTLVIVAASA